METMMNDARSHSQTEMSPRAKLLAYALETASEYEGWEGELLTARQVTERHGISANELRLYRQKNQVISFPFGMQKRKYPAAQFVGQAPTPGLDQLIPIVGSQGETWRWLLESCTDLDEDRPLNRLQCNDVENVLAAARRQYEI
jgi:hypothetical protein